MRAAIFLEVVMGMEGEVWDVVHAAKLCDGLTTSTHKLFHTVTFSKRKKEGKKKEGKKDIRPLA